MKGIIVEDEYLSLEELKYIIEENSNIEILETFENGIDVLNFVSKNEVDVVFLDINIPGIDGMALGRTLNNFKNKPKIVFITAYKEYAVEAFELEAFDYIMKPYLEERIINTLNKLKQEDKTSVNKYIEDNQEIKEKIKLKGKNGLNVVTVDDIFMCEAEEKETFVYTKDKKYVVTECISEIYKELPKDRFFKTHRSYIVNLSKIKSVVSSGNSTYKLILENGDLECWVSRSQIKKFRELINM